MTSYNDITGDKIATRTITKDYENNFDRIFRKKDKVGGVSTTPDKPVEPAQLELFDENRIDTIGQNGNEGLHYDGDENV
jgi:hypothetical protein